MMESQSFDLALTNLFVGLCKGNPHLLPHSGKFRKLGYRVFSIEAYFVIPNVSSISPDMVILSKKLGNTLVLEWTARDEPDNHKQRQLNEKYAKITTKSLVESLAVPVRGAESFDVVLIVRRDVVPSFLSFLRDKGHRFPLLVFEQIENGGTLEKTKYVDFTEVQTNQFFSTKMRFRRIPFKYLPFSISKPSPKSLAPFVLKQLAAFLVKGRSRFTLEELCRAYVPAWELIGPRKQGEIGRCTRGLLNQLVRFARRRPVIKRVQDQPPSWEFMDVAKWRSRPSDLRSLLDRFRDKVSGISVGDLFEEYY